MYARLEDELLRKRTVLLMGDIDCELSKRVDRQLIDLNTESADPIKLIINSVGGDVDCGVDLIHTIQIIESPVVGIVVGSCKSMAITVLSACDERLATKYSQFFMHALSSGMRIGSHDTRKDLIERVDHAMSAAKEMERFCIELVAERSGMSVNEVRKLRSDGEKHDRLIMAREAKELGLIDNIVDTKELSFLGKLVRE